MISTLIKVFGPRDIREISKIFDRIDHHWKETDNFLISFNRYLFEINQKYQLKLPDELTIRIILALVTDMTVAGLNKANVVKLFSEFIYYYVFGGESPNKVRHSNEYIAIHLHRSILQLLISKTDSKLPYEINNMFAKRCEIKDEGFWFPSVFKNDISKYWISVNSEQAIKWLLNPYKKQGDDVMSFTTSDLNPFNHNPSLSYFICLKRFYKYNLMIALFKSAQPRPHTYDYGFTEPMGSSPFKTYWFDKTSIEHSCISYYNKALRESKLESGLAEKYFIEELQINSLWWI